MAGREVRPGLDPDSHGVSGTLFAALHGDLVPRPDRERVTDRDPYIQFHDRARTMGWLDNLWGMNDAGQRHPLAAPGSALVTWFQVGIDPVPGHRPLPVQAFLRCAGDVTARLGTLTLRTAHVLLPAQCLDVSVRPEHMRMPSLSDAAWFDDVRSWTPIHVTVDSGQNPAILDAARSIHRVLGELPQDVFRYESTSEHDPVLPPLADALWSGPPRHRVRFTGTLSEWSLDAIGWLGGLLADLAAREGAGVPLLLTVDRSTGSPP